MGSPQGHMQHKGSFFEEPMTSPSSQDDACSHFGVEYFPLLFSAVVMHFAPVQKACIVHCVSCVVWHSDCSGSSPMSQAQVVYPALAGIGGKQQFPLPSRSSQVIVPKKVGSATPLALQSFLVPKLHVHAAGTQHWVES